jgi:uncharacterized protein YkwD
MFMPEVRGMIKTTTAPQGDSVSRAWAGSKRLVVAAAVIAGSLTAFVPAAAAQGNNSCQNADSPIAVTSRPHLQKAVVCLINRQRAQRHLPLLRTDQRLNRSAQGWTNTMVNRAAFTHGTNFSARISAAGFDWSMAGENIATGYTTPAEVVSEWMASTGHCQNILSPSFADVGTGVSARSSEGLGSSGGTWTQDFGLPMGAHAPSHNSGPAHGCPYTGA